MYIHVHVHCMLRTAFHFPATFSKFNGRQFSRSTVYMTCTACIYMCNRHQILHNHTCIHVRLSLDFYCAYILHTHTTDAPRSRIMKYPILLKEVKKKVSILHLVSMAIVYCCCHNNRLQLVIQTTNYLIKQ